MPHINGRSRAIMLRNLFFPLLETAGALILVFSLLIGMGGIAHSQIQRSFLNLSFEDPLPASCTPPVGSANLFVNSAVLNGWATTHATLPNQCGGPGRTIETWWNGAGQFVAHQGRVHVELNAFERSTLYQSVCLLQGDKVTWKFAHRARAPVGGGNDSMAFQLAEDDGNVASWGNTIGVATVSSPNDALGSVLSCGMGTCNAPILQNKWNVYEGTFTWTAASIQKRFGIVSLSSADGNIAIGNFLYSISISGITPIVQLDIATGQGLYS